MNELLLCIIFIPLIFLAPKNRAGFTPWLPALLGAALVGYFAWLRSDDPVLWGGIAIFFAMTLTEFAERKKLQPYTVLSALFFAQALLAQNIEIVIICIAFGDLFLNVEIFTNHEINEKNRAIQNISRSLFSLLPVTFGVLLGLHGPYFISIMAITIVLRLFSWPFAHWICKEKGDPSYFNLLVSAVSSLSLWHGQDFSVFPEWPLIWMVITALLSLGAQYTEVYISITLGAFCISPTYGLMGAALWPLLVFRGKSLYLLTVFLVIGGALISEAASKIIMENTVYVIGGVSAVILVRPFVAIQAGTRPWVNEVRDILLSGILFGLFIYILPAQIPVLGPAGAVFASAFILSYVIGKFLYSKHPRVFSPLPGFKGPLVPDLTSPVPSLNEKPGREADMGESALVSKFYRTLESESHLVWLLGLLGVALYWGVR